MIYLLEVTVPVIVGQILQHVGRIKAAPREIYRPFVQVGGEDLDGPLRQFRAQQIGHQERQRVRLLTRRASRRPEAYYLIARSRPIDDSRQDIFLEVGEGLRVTKELRHLDQERHYEFSHFFRMLFQKFRVIAKVPVVRHGHAPGDAPQNGRGFVGAEINVGLAIDQHQHVTQRVIDLFLRLVQFDALDQIVDQRPHLFEVGDVINGGGRQRHRHRRVASGFGVLNDHRPAGLLYVYSARRPVRAGAGQDYGDQPVAVRFGGARQQQINRGSRPVAVIVFDPDPTRRYTDG